jgi:hypothetical protein
MATTAADAARPVAVSARAGHDRARDQELSDGELFYMSSTESR